MKPHAKNGEATLTLPYGLVWWEDNNRPVHRIIWALLKRPIPAGFEIHHKCGNTLCCNVDHLQLVTKAQHARLGGNAIKEACKNGHEFTPGNTYFRPTGGRACRRCRADAEERRREKLGLRKGVPSTSELNRQKTHCPNGHAYTPENTYIDPHGWRKCRICRQLEQQRWKEKRKAHS